MPQLKQLVITVGAKKYTYSPRNVQNGSALFINQGESFAEDQNVVVNVLPRPQAATTKKAYLRSTTPLVTACEDACATPVSRGQNLFNTEGTMSMKATAAERALAYDQHVQLLLDPDVRLAFINAEPFFG